MKHCLNPLEIGSICNSLLTSKIDTLPVVSIPLKSGLFVIISKVALYARQEGLNPLEIGSICNNCREYKNVV